MSISLLVVVALSIAIFWIILGYPLWIAARASRTKEEGPVSQSLLPAVTAVIPVHNGGEFLAAKIQSVLASEYPADRLDIIVVSDGSTDDTDVIAQSFACQTRVRSIRLAKAGKAAAITAALPLIQADLVLLTDVRQVLDRDCVVRIVARFVNPEVGVVSGTLKIRRGETLEATSIGLYWAYESWIRNSLSRIDSIIGATGPIYAMRRSLVSPLPKGCILDDMWLPMQAVFAGYRSVVAVDAVAWDYPTTASSEFNRKVRTQAGLYQLLRLERRLLSIRTNRLFWPFLTLKLGRLLLPHLLIALAVTSFWLPNPINVICLFLQFGFYSIYFADRLIPEGKKVKRLTSPLAAFITLIAAAFCAQMIFFRDPEALWKRTVVQKGRPGD